MAEPFVDRLQLDIAITAQVRHNVKETLIRSVRVAMSRRDSIGKSTPTLVEARFSKWTNHRFARVSATPKSQDGSTRSRPLPFPRSCLAARHLLRFGSAYGGSRGMGHVAWRSGSATARRRTVQRDHWARRGLGCLRAAPSIRRKTAPHTGLYVCVCVHLLNCARDCVLSTPPFVAAAWIRHGHSLK